MNLHSWWDGLVTQHESNPQQEARASELLALHGDAVTPAHLAAAPADWAAEGQVLAAAHVYTPEMRERAERHLNGRHCREFNAGYVQRPVGYIDQARAVAERQAVLAGLRLAALMETLLD